MLEPPPLPSRLLCGQCGAEQAPRLLSCPGCGALVHAAQLKEFAAAAAKAEPRDQLLLWRQALALLPAESSQANVVAAKIDALSRQIDAGSIDPARGPRWKGVAGTGGALLLLLAKFKSVILLLLGQGKFVLLGLTKMGTLLSMFASFGVYWNLYGWKFAGGLILSIYIHEMGHVHALRRFGLTASAPMFIPGFGAFISLPAQYLTAREDARIGLAGPIWGLGAALAAAALGFAFHLPVLLVIAQWGATINLFNLTPVWTLDGARGFHALRRRERFCAVAFLAAAWAPTSPGIALLALGAGIYGATRGNEPQESDPRCLLEYAGLCIALSAFTWLPMLLRSIGLVH